MHSRTRTRRSSWKARSLMVVSLAAAFWFFILWQKNMQLTTNTSSLLEAPTTLIVSSRYYTQDSSKAKADEIITKKNRVADAAPAEKKKPVMKKDEPVTMKESVKEEDANKEKEPVKTNIAKDPLENSELNNTTKEPGGKKVVRRVKSKANDMPRRTKTDAGVDVSDPALFVEGVDHERDSSTATVMGMATGYGLKVYQRFVGSLRKSGFQGRIILGVAPNVQDDILEYLEYRNVTAKVMRWVDCTYGSDDKNTIFKKTTCADPYPDIKIRWSRFPLIRDWLIECKECTGPVLIMDVRDSFFQLDPFGPGSPVVKGLQVFEEHKIQTTQHWLTEWPIGNCKGIRFNETMLCSGTTVGTRVAMIKYLEAMYAEMKVWIEDPKCRFNINGDDQSIHNYLYYTGQLPFATAIPNRSGGIVNTVGKEAAMVAKEHVAKMKEEKNLEKGEAMREPFEGAEGSRWIGGKHGHLIDDEGFFTEFDGSRSRVVHQWDRLGGPFIDRWMAKQTLFSDPIPIGLQEQT